MLSINANNINYIKKTKSSANTQPQEVTFMANPVHHVQKNKAIKYFIKFLGSVLSLVGLKNLSESLIKNDNNRKYFGRDSIEIGTENSNVSDELTDVEEKINENNAKILEGGIKDSDLDEIPYFATDLMMSKDVGEPAFVDTREAKLYDGKFIDGEFVPKHIISIFPNRNNPFNRKVISWKFTDFSGAWRRLAENKKELSDQIAEILKEKRNNKWLLKHIDEFLEENPDVTISDFSEILYSLDYVGKAKPFLHENKFNRINNFERFKSNAEIYANFYHNVNEEKPYITGYETPHCKKLQLHRFFDDEFFEWLEKIEPEEFQENCNSFMEMRTYLKENINIKKYLTTVHDKKFFKRVKFLDKWNAEHTYATLGYMNGNGISPYTELDTLSDDEEFRNLLERMKYCDKALDYSREDADCILHRDNYIFKLFKTFYSTIPHGINKEIYREYHEIYHFSRKDMEKFTEFCNKMPEDMLNALFDKDYFHTEKNCIFKCFNTNPNIGYCCTMNEQIEYPRRTPDELVKRIDLLRRVRPIVEYRYGGKTYFRVSFIAGILLRDIKDVDKAVEFLDAIDKYTFGSLSIDGIRGNDHVYNTIELFNVINNDNLGRMTQNAKVYNELPDEYRKGMGGKVNFDIPTDEFKNRVNFIKKCNNNLTLETCMNILDGKLPYDRLFQLPDKVIKKIFEDGYINLHISQLGLLTEDGFQKFLKILNEIISQDNSITRLLFYLSYTSFLFNELTQDELNIIHPQCFVRSPDCQDINKIKKRIQIIPENLKPYMRYLDIGTNILLGYSSTFDSDISENHALLAMQCLNNLGSKNLKNIGTNTINEFIDRTRINSIPVLSQQKLEQLNLLPQDLLKKMQDRKTGLFNLLTNDSVKLDTNLIIERYQLLKDKNCLEKISSDNLYTIMFAGKEQFAIIMKILHTYKEEDFNKTNGEITESDEEKKNINYLDSIIENIPPENIIQKNHNFIFNSLINKKNKVCNIAPQLNYIYKNIHDNVSDDERIKFAQQVVNDFIIKRSDINDDENLLQNLLSAIKKSQDLIAERRKYKLIIQNLNSKKATRKEIINLFMEAHSIKENIVLDTLLNNTDYKFETINRLEQAMQAWNGDIGVDLLYKVLIRDGRTLKEENVVDIISRTHSENLELAEILCCNRELDFPEDKIAFLLYCVISGDFSPMVVAQKVKTFFNLGFDDDFIRDVIENTQTLSFYSDEVLKTLQQKKINEPELKIRDLIRGLTGNIDRDLQGKIDTLILLSKLNDNEIAVFKKYGVDVNRKIEQLENLIDKKYPLISTSKEDVNIFLKVLANTQKTDDIIRNADFEQFGKAGIPLQYSREEFIKKMNELNSSGIIQFSGNVEIPTLKLSEEDVISTKAEIEKLRQQKTSENTEIIIDGKKQHGIRFLNTQGGSNKAYFTEIGDRLYYIKYPDKDKLAQSIQEVMASEFYRAAGIDAPNMKLIFDENGEILGMASEYIPGIENEAHGNQLFDSFVTDAWLANWDAPKHGHNNSVMRNGACLKIDVGGSLEYRARGERKDSTDDFTNEVHALTTLIEQNNDYSTMTKEDVLSSLAHVTKVSDEQIWTIISKVPARFRNYALGQKMLTRRDFIKKFAEIFEQMDETKYNNILDMVNNAKVQTINQFDAGVDVASLFGYEQTPLGFEGLLNTRNLNNLGLSPKQLEVAKKMKEEIEKYTKYNRVSEDVTLSDETKYFLNSILKGIPEFAAYFSKPQHSGTQYALDVHILKVLQDSLRDSDYQKLNNEDRIVLKFATLLHDVGKRYLGTDSDTGHATLSAEYVYSILDRFNLSDDIKDRIISIVANHHWFKDYNLGVINAETMATLARRPHDWLIYKIMAKADLINVSEKFAIEHIPGATSVNDLSQAFDKSVFQIEELVKRIKDNQVVVTPTKWVDVPERMTSNGEKLDARTFPTEKKVIDGKEEIFRVLNLTQIPDDEDMFKYGFNHITKKMLRFIIHMPGDSGIRKFNIFKTLSKNPLNNSAQSLSMVSIDDIATYSSRIFGLILDINNANISHAYYANSNSGNHKGLQNFVNEIFQDMEERSFVKNKFIEFLKTERGIEIDDDEYGKIIEYIINKKYPETQFRSEYKIGDRIFTNKDLIIDGKIYKTDDILDAFTYSRDEIINESIEKRHGWHNEIVGLNTKIRGLVAKVDSFDELPDYFLRFALENNYPIILLGKQ